ncbi:hypothetical protein CFAM422_004740 [Trichoderma lentiforme]|uniref:Uncharacterized protein n=1 Tax=Trichoderma lentiforme TaxID=1567552 RepID=A0A9P4XI58_9HYPO|nr:hypothetical protein CFAM422_004740 [Trichoderma lentiforme]
MHLAVLGQAPRADSGLAGTWQGPGRGQLRRARDQSARATGHVGAANGEKRRRLWERMGAGRAGDWVEAEKATGA